MAAAGGNINICYAVFTQQAVRRSDRIDGCCWW